MVGCYLAPGVRRRRRRVTTKIAKSATLPKVGEAERAPTLQPSSLLDDPAAAVTLAPPSAPASGDDTGDGGAPASFVAATQVVSGPGA
jgi:hypothetical protein